MQSLPTVHCQINIIKYFQSIMIWIVFVANQEENGKMPPQKKDRGANHLYRILIQDLNMHAISR